jgi:ABC-2 type transport system ATP-binding protein
VSPGEVRSDDAARPESAGPAIRVSHLWHRFGNVDVLRDVSFDVGPSEIFGFIGPNGAGKTTTIRIMATLLEPSAGKVEIDGWDVTIDPQEVRKVIGYMPDHAGVYERLTVREYLEFFADAYRIPTAGASYPVVDAVMELTDLVKLGEKLVATMSKGMKQRLQIARTLLHDPKVLILDEPASDLDPRARIEIRDLLVELRSMGKTIFLSSHILTELADLCTSVAILERGKLVVAGPIDEIARRLPSERRAAAADDAPTNLGVPAHDAPSLDAPLDAPQPPATRTATRSVRVRVLGPSDAVYPAVVSLTSVRGVAPGPGGTVSIEYAGDSTEVAAIVRALVHANVPVVSVEPERNDLERIFLEVTKGEVQ